MQLCSIVTAGMLDTVATTKPEALGEFTTFPPGAGSQPVEVVEEGKGYRVVRHVAGVTRVPANPQRICALSSADEVLSLGVMPVAHSIDDGNFPEYLLAGSFLDWMGLAICGLLSLSVLQSLWRPTLISRVANQADERSMATSLNIESQSRCWGSPSRSPHCCFYLCK